MKKILFALLIFSTSLISQVQLKTYIKKNGTIVYTHQKTNTNKIHFNNFSSKNNAITFTGKKVTEDSFKNSLIQKVNLIDSTYLSEPGEDQILDWPSYPMAQLFIKKNKIEK